MMACISCGQHFNDKCSEKNIDKTKRSNAALFSRKLTSVKILCSNGGSGHFYTPSIFAPKVFVSSPFLIYVFKETATFFLRIWNYLAFFQNEYSRSQWEVQVFLRRGGGPLPLDPPLHAYSTQNSDTYLVGAGGGSRVNVYKGNQLEWTPSERDASLLKMTHTRSVQLLSSKWCFIPENDYVDLTHTQFAQLPSELEFTLNGEFALIDVKWTFLFLEPCTSSHELTIWIWCHFYHNVWSLLKI